MDQDVEYQSAARMRCDTDFDVTSFTPTSISDKQIVLAETLPRIVKNMYLGDLKIAFCVRNYYVTRTNCDALENSIYRQKWLGQPTQ